MQHISYIDYEVCAYPLPATSYQFTKKKTNNENNNKYLDNHTKKPQTSPEATTTSNEFIQGSSIEIEDSVYHYYPYPSIVEEYLDLNKNLLDRNNIFIIPLEHTRT